MQAERLGRRQHALLRHAARRPRAGDRHPPARPRTRRCCSCSTPTTTWWSSRCPRRPAARSWTLLLDTNMPELPEGTPFDFGHAYEVTGALAAGARADLSANPAIAAAAAARRPRAPAMLALVIVVGGAVPGARGADPARARHPVQLRAGAGGALPRALAARPRRLDLHHGDRSAVAVLGAIGWVAAQPGDLARRQAARVPPATSPQKIHALRAPGSGDLGKAAEAIKELEKQAAPERAAARR